MTGPEHYREAERLLTEEVFRDKAGGTTTRSYQETVAAAQVHATLALAAATALARIGTDNPGWIKVAGPKRSPRREGLPPNPPQPIPGVTSPDAQR